MNAYANIAKEMKGALEKNSITQKLLSLDIVVFFASIGLQLFFWLLNLWSPWVFLSNFLSLFNTIFYYVMIVGALLTIANRKDQMLAIGCWGYAAYLFISFLRQLLYRYAHYFNLSTLFVLVLWVFLGLAAFFAANPDKMPKFNKPAPPVVPPQQNAGGQWGQPPQQNANGQWGAPPQQPVPPQQNTAGQWGTPPQQPVPPQPKPAGQWNAAPQQPVPPQQNTVGQWGAPPQQPAPPQPKPAGQWNAAPQQPVPPQQNTAGQWNNNVKNEEKPPVQADETPAPAPEAPVSRKCPVCNADVPADGKFCPVCGAKM